MSEIKVAVIGAGFIGRGWIAAFARGGMRVSVWSRRRETSDAALDYLREILPQLSSEDLLNGRRPEDVLGAISICETLEGALADVDYVQENVPEDIEVKRRILSELDALAPPGAIIGSSTSALLPSKFMNHLRGRRRCIVAHPLNPPHLIPATEIVVAPWNDQIIVDRTCEILREAGQRPIVLKKEIDGYIVNRLQAAILNEAFRLVAGGYASIADVDAAVRDGLALRWSFMGLFETIDLNATKGVRDYVERNMELYENLLSQMRTRVDWAGPVLEEIERDRRTVLPADKLYERQLWRDRRLMALAVHKKNADKSLGG
jgi:3-hydroxyacyl-CoA dehydrogenase